MKTAYPIILLASLTILGCALHDIRQLAPEPIDAYHTKATANGISVAAEPFSTKEKAEAAFTVDVTQQGIVPILLVLENHTKDNVLLVKDDI